MQKEIQRIVVDANKGDLSGRISADQEEGFFYRPCKRYQRVDSATQQNSSLAQETSLVAGKLSNRSTDLEGMVQKFTISDFKKNSGDRDYDIAV